MAYLITSPGGREIIINAPNSTKAKKVACKFWGIKPSDPWCGLSALSAKKYKMQKEGIKKC